MRTLALCAAVGLLAAGTALAARGDPRERFTAGDQAKARSMLVRKSDLGADYSADRSPQDDADFYCNALDESDLTLSGEAKSPEFSLVLPPSPRFVSSIGQVYVSAAQSLTSWRRGTSPAGIRCLESGLRREAEQEGYRVISIRRLSLPRFAQRSIAFRVTSELQGTRFYIDLVALQYTRAQAGIVVGSLFSPPPRALEVRLAGIVATRMRAAMRNA